MWVEFDMTLKSPSLAYKPPSEVNDETEVNDVDPKVSYQITSYGTDFDVDGIVKRVKRGSMITPSFQRNYVWTQKDASIFIESLLLGLPVPGVFLAKEGEDGKFLIIDGQQRIKTLYFFFEGVFKEDEPTSRDRKEFKLIGVKDEYLNKTYKTLTELERNKLNDFPIHATVIKQDSPDDGDTSIYHIFDRLNSKGRKLTPQEIRAAVSHGKLMNLLNELNENPNWRLIFGSKNNRLKDHELILRFLAFYADMDNYSAPMAEFLNKFAKKYRNPTDEKLSEFREIFNETINTVYHSLGKKAFRLKSAINAAIFDSFMVAVSNLSENQKANHESIKSEYEDLLKDSDYTGYISKATANETNLKKRFDKAAEIIGQVDAN